MQKTTKDLFLKLKGLRPIVHGVSNDYDTDWKTGQVIELWFLHMPNKYIPYKTEKELQDAIKVLIDSTETDLGFRLPETFKKIPQ
jgi:hypothetical protein